MTYQNTLKYLFAQLPMYHRVGVQAYKADLDNTVALCALLGNPQESFRTIHVAGTNGKGSVSHMLASILQTAGFKTGLYTSPHLKDFRERIRVNGKMIAKQAVTRFMARYQEASEAIRPSFFELTVGMAFDYFREQKVEIAVIEVGLGGRLDSTNIVTPQVSVITNISFDHMQLLGNSLREIAAEKAGIIKPGIPVVVGETQEEVAPVFREKAAGCFSEILFADQHYRAEMLQPEYSGAESVRQLDIYRDGTLVAGRLESPLTGLYQLKNIQTVMAACDILNNLGFGLSLPVIRKGIRNVLVNTGLAGRWQILSREPLTICDTGHNESGLREVLAQIALTPHQRLHIVFGVVNDKHLAPILNLLPKNADYYFCKPDIPRGLDARELRLQANEAGLRGESYSSVAQALEAAREDATAGDLVFVGGSTFVVAEVV
ncbi:MAG: folylpolyglutamate synthase/dihydrofolate synthase family protein [Bacteroidota bacterium]